MRELISVSVGLVILGALIVDVFGTVFVPRGGAGVVSSRLYRAVWNGWVRVAARSGHRRRRVLALAGPVLLPLTVVLWIVELVSAFAFLYLPFAGQLSVPTGDSSPPWVTSLYVSGYAATTLGVGDVYATAGALRILITVEAGLGFALFSISITYLLSVYGALLRATALSLSISSFIGRDAGEDPIDLVCRTVRTQAEEQTLAWLRHVLSDLSHTGQAQAQYPLIAYFHIPRDDRALPIVLGDLLRLLTVCATLLRPSAFPGLTSSPTMVSAVRMVVSFVGEHAEELGGRGRQVDEQEDLETYVTARRRLQEAGIALRDDEQARSLYLDLRRRWSTAEQELLGHFGYHDGDSVSGRSAP